VASGIAACLLSAPAVAADIGQAPVYTPPPQASYSSQFDWSGPYAGVTAGYGWGHFNVGGDVDGLVGGAYAGFNHQFGSGVYGIEMDGVVSGADGSSALSPEVDWLSTVRLRAGHAKDNFLFYGTGSLALAGASLSAAGVSDSNVHFGWTLGAGVEAALTDRIIARLEYQYVNLNDRNYSVGPTSTDFDMNTLRVGLGLKF